MKQLTQQNTLMKLIFAGFNLANPKNEDFERIQYKKSTVLRYFMMDLFSQVA